MIDVGLAPGGVRLARQLQTGKAWIAQIAHICGRHRVAAQPEKAERAALEAVRDLLVATPDFREPVTIAGTLEQPELFGIGFAAERVACRIVERDELRLARLRYREIGDEVGDWPRIGQPARSRVAGRDQAVARHQQIAAEGLAVEEQATRQAKRRVELAVERGLEARDIDAELAQQIPGGRPEKCVRRLKRLAAAIADDAAAIERELVALGVAAEIVVVVED